MKNVKINTGVVALVALVVVCIGSFLGVRAMKNSLEPATTVQPTYNISTQATTETTTVPTTESTTFEVPTTQITTAQSVITTFAVSTTESTTQTTTETTTAPTLPTTTQPTTQATTTQTVTMPTTQSTTASALSGDSNGAVFDDGLAGYQYSSDGNYYFTSSDPWQRAIGYGEIYDVLSPFAIFYLDTFRCKFNYDNKDWCIQFWKGQYGMIFIGTEIGVYTKDPSRDAEYYDCASNEDALYMTCTAYRDGVEIYTRDYAKYWWCTGFVPGRLDKMSDRSEITLNSRLTMKDKEMREIFCDALEENGFTKSGSEEFMTYKVKGLDVYIYW